MKTIKFPRLYSRRTDGGLQIWDLECEGDKYRVTSGMVDGKHHTNDWTVCQGKNIGKSNATTPEQQAAAEAQALWDKKVREGYRESEAALLKVTLFEPMLAHKYKDCADKVVLPVLSQPKLDGIRVIARATGLFSRKGKPHLNLQHVEQELAAVFKQHPTLVIDGEGYADKLSNDFNQIVHLIKQLKPTAQDRADSAKMIKYHVYDCYFTDHPEYVFNQRQLLLWDILKDIKSVQLVQTDVCDTQEILDNKYAEYLAAGYEGQMIRKNVAYANKRTDALLKRKEYLDSEYTIIDVVEGIGNRAGTAGAVTLSNGDKPAFNAGIRGNRDHVIQLLKNKRKVIGQLGTVRYQNLSPDGVPRFPVLLCVRDYE